MFSYGSQNKYNIFKLEKKLTVNDTKTTKNSEGFNVKHLLNRTAEQS